MVEKFHFNLLFLGWWGWGEIPLELWHGTIKRA